MKNDHFTLCCHTAAEKIKYPPDHISLQSPALPPRKGGIFPIYTAYALCYNEKNTNSHFARVISGLWASLFTPGFVE